MQTEPLDLSIKKTQIPDQLLQLQHNFNLQSNQLHLLRPPIKYIYNPTQYAHVPFAAYIRKYCQTRKKVLIVGMNPGPFGMCQTGVPFGDVSWVKNWMGIEGEVDKPPLESPQRRIEGFNSTRREISGDLLWTFWREVCGTAERFFRDCFVINYCVLFFMQEERNLTPQDLVKVDLKELWELCDRLYLDIVELLQPELIVCVGRYVEGRSKKLFRGRRRVVYMPHPSRRTPGNHNWLDKARQCFVDNNLQEYFQ